MKQRIACPLRVPLEPSSMPIVRTVQVRPDTCANPLPHKHLIEPIVDHPGADLYDSFHGLSPDGLHYFGLFSFVTDPVSLDFQWVIAISNSNICADAIIMHSGIVINDMAMALSFHHGSMLLQKYLPVNLNDLPALVNENMYSLRQWFNLEFDRCEAFKSHKLTEKDAHHIVCIAIETEIISGRNAFELLMAWRNPEWPYICPRNLWSLFCLFSWILNRLKAPVLIARTMALYDFFNNIAKFKHQPTKWVQQQLV